MLDGFGLGGGLTRWDAEAVEVKVKYEGFIKRQEGQVAKVAGKMNKKIPEGIDYGAITTLRMEEGEAGEDDAADRGAGEQDRGRDPRRYLVAAGAPGGWKQAEGSREGRQTRSQGG